MSDLKVYQFAIVGAGVSGLTFAKRLIDKSISYIVLEKSKGLGGRMATRRWKDQLFDHGAQHIKENIKSKVVFDLWDQNKLLTPWLSDSKICHEGMSKLAKKLCENLNVNLETKVQNISKVGSHYVVGCENSDLFTAENIVLSTPLPQALEILSNSNFKYDSKLENIIYAKAVVFLISHKENSPHSLPDYKELDSGPVFSISNQNKKFHKSGVAYTFTMSPEWSEFYFSKQDEDMIAQFHKSLKKLNIKIPENCEIQVKKWRYSHPLSKWNENYFKIENEKIYLIGDAFGGPSINGAVISALEFNT